MRSMSGDQTFEFLATHIQNDALILISPNFLAEANARFLQNPNLLRQVVTVNVAFQWYERLTLRKRSILTGAHLQPFTLFAYKSHQKVFLIEMSPIISCL